MRYVKNELTVDRYLTNDQYLHAVLPWLFLNDRSAIIEDLGNGKG